jgi:molybdopterin molybdotransferase
MKDMLGREEVVSVERALALLLENLHAGSPREVPVRIEDALGRVCARDVISSEDLPGFARSTVDGYAVAAEDTFGATETMPAYLNLGRELVMGEEADFLLAKGEACGIPTGGMLPRGADAVVMFEHVQTIDKRMLEALRPVTPGENVIRAGEDVKEGETIIVRGHRIRPQDIGACAGIGVTEVYVYEPPVVSVLSTGDEVVPASQRPRPGQVRDVNSYILSGMISAVGCVPLRKGIFRDDYNTIRAAVEAAMTDSRAIVISGGTSVGTKDMLAKVIDDIGGPGVLFHGLSLKPGKPMIGGMVGGRTPVFGLPGHPAAVGVCFGIFIEPVLHILSGSTDKFARYKKKTVKAKLTKNVASSLGREEHIRVLLEEGSAGLLAVPVLGKSGLIRTLVKADGTFVIPVNNNGVEKGEEIEVRLF